MRPILRPLSPPTEQIVDIRLVDFGAEDAVDWQTVLSAECGFHAARRLHRSLAWSAVTTRERISAVTDRRPGRFGRASLTLAAALFRWIPSPRS